MVYDALSTSRLLTIVEMRRVAAAMIQ